MTPDEAKETLLNAGFFAKWDGRYLLGGSTYKPGNPGVFEGIRFTITLVEPGVCKAEVTDFQDVTTELQPEPNLRSLAGGDRKDLAWAVHGVLEQLWNHLDRVDRGASPNVPLASAIEACREFPTATTDVELLSQLIFQQLHGYGGFEPLALPAPRPGLSEQERLAADLRTQPEAPKPWGDPVRVRNGSDRWVAVPSKNLVSYGQRGTVRTEKSESRQRRAFHWAPLASKDTWPTTLRPISPFHHLAVEREMSLVLFMSAVRQVLEDTPEWLELIVFSTEPADGKLTACFLASKVDPLRAEKPQWLKDLASPEEKKLEDQFSKS